MRGLGCWIVLLSCVFAGCRETARNLRPSSWMEKMRALRPTANGELPQLHLALVRQPIGDRYLNHDLWSEVDENILPERRPVFAANGFRVGTLSGTLPAELHRLVTDEKTCVSARQVTVQPGRWFALPLTDRDSCELELAHDGELVPVRYERAQCGFGLQIEAESQTRTIIRLEPKVQHGSTQILTRAAEDRTRLTPFIGRPEEKFAKLGLEISLTPNEYLIIGADLKAGKSLGRACFTQTDGENQVQYLLIVRAIPAKDPKPADHATKKASPHASNPLAIQSLTPPPPARSGPKIDVRGRMP